MKVDILKIFIAIGVGYLIFNNLMNSCSEDPAVKLIEDKFEENKKDIKKINADYQALMDSVFALRKQRVQQNNYFKYEITKIDSIYASGNVDISIVDSIIRFWTDKVYGTPGFFKSAEFGKENLYYFEQNGTSNGKQDTSARSELLLPGIQPEKRNGQINGSSW